MTGSEHIRAKILEEAQAAATARLEAAKSEADAIGTDALGQRREAEKQVLQRISAGKAAQVRRNEATLQTELRKQKLFMRQQLVEEAFQLAVAAIVDLPAERYGRFLADEMLQAAWQGDAELAVTAADRSRLGDAWLAAVDTRRQLAGLAGTTHFSTEPLKAAGGFVACIGEVEINGTLEVMLAGSRTTLEREVVETLFSDKRPANG